MEIQYGDLIFRKRKNHDDGHMTTFVRVRVYEEKRLNLYVRKHTEVQINGG